MNDSDYLKFFIHEDLYDIKEETEVDLEKKTEGSQPVAPIVEEPNVELETPNKTETPTVVEPIEKPKGLILSENQVLIVFDNPESKTMQPSQSAYLEKILGAVKFTMNQVDLCQISDLSQRKIDDYKQIISFTEKYKGLSVGKYEVGQNKSSKVLLADDLTIISESVELRKKLWESLKEMFGV
ncbi:MAG: hypothetical protein JXR07_06930 [Reichenbachiella sp.]